LMAPRTISRGAKSPPIASTAMRISGASALSALGRGVDLHRHHLAAVVIAASGADMMGALQLMAMRAFHKGRRADGQVRTPLALSRLGYLSLGDAHA
jgi:hypothetical protein